MLAIGFHGNALFQFVLRENGDFELRTLLRNTKFIYIFKALVLLYGNHLPCRMLVITQSIGTGSCKLKVSSEAISFEALSHPIHSVGPYFQILLGFLWEDFRISFLGVLIIFWGHFINFGIFKV